MDVYVRQVDYYLQHRDEFFDEIYTVAEECSERLRTFLREKFALYELRTPMKDEMREAAIRWRTNVEQEFGNQDLDSIALRFLAPNFHIIFDADDAIDEEPNVERQRKMFTASLEAIKSENYDQLPFPAEFREMLVRDILTGPEKRAALVEELAAEVRLLDPNVDWIEATLDRIRIAFYSAIICVNEPALAKYVEEYKSAALAEKLYRIAEDKLGKMNPNSVRAMRLVWFAVAMTATGDDLIDLEEDLRTNKNTGMTRCGNPDALYASVLTFVRTQLDPDLYANGYERWVVEFFLWFYHEPNEVIDFVTSHSSLAAKFVYKRRETNPSSTNK